MLSLGGCGGCYPLVGVRGCYPLVGVRGGGAISWWVWGVLSLGGSEGRGCYLLVGVGGAIPWWE